MLPPRRRAPLLPRRLASVVSHDVPARVVIASAPARGIWDLNTPDGWERRRRPLLSEGPAR